MVGKRQGQEPRCWAQSNETGQQRHAGARGVDGHGWPRSHTGGHVTVPGLEAVGRGGKLLGRITLAPVRFKEVFSNGQTLCVEPGTPPLLPDYLPRFPGSADSPVLRMSTVRSLEECNPDVTLLWPGSHGGLASWSVRQEANWSWPGGRLRPGWPGHEPGGGGGRVSAEGQGGKARPPRVGPAGSWRGRHPCVHVDGRPFWVLSPSFCDECLKAVLPRLRTDSLSP